MVRSWQYCAVFGIALGMTSGVQSEVYAEISPPALIVDAPAGSIRQLQNYTPLAIPSPTHDFITVANVERLPESSVTSDLPKPAAVSADSTVAVKSELKIKSGESANGPLSSSVDDAARSSAKIVLKQGSEAPEVPGSADGLRWRMSSEPNGNISTGTANSPDSLADSPAPAEVVPHVASVPTPADRLRTAAIRPPVSLAPVKPRTTNQPAIQAQPAGPVTTAQRSSKVELPPLPGSEDEPNMLPAPSSPAVAPRELNTDDPTPSAKPMSEATQLAPAHVPAPAPAVPAIVPPSEDAAALSAANPDNLPTELVRERFPNGQVKVERHVVQDETGNYLNHGAWLQFDERGRMTGSGVYNRGIREGRWTRWFAENEAAAFSGPAFHEFAAPFKSEATFDKDRLHGTWSVTDSKNRNVCKWNFENGVTHGTSSWYYANGFVQREIPFKHGEINGSTVEYANDGKELKRDEFVNGRKTVLQTEWHAPTLKKSEGWILRSHEIIKPQFDFWKGTATFTVIGSEGTNQRHGEWTWWHKNGQKQMEGLYSFDQPAGKLTWWYSNGQKQLEGEYIDGKENGKFVWYYSNGMKMMTGQFVAGLQVDTWMRWNDDGKLREVAQYSADGEQIELKEFAPGPNGSKATAAPQQQSSRPAASLK